MKKNMKNDVHLEGYLYSHSLEKRVTGEKSKNPGTEYITGTIEIATDDEILNIVSTHFTFVTAKTAKGTSNPTFDTLNNIIEKNLKTVVDFGADQAAKLRVDTSIALNDFYSDRTGTEELVSVKRNEGGFVHSAPTITDKLNDRNTFDCDILITKVRHVEADEERKTPEKTIVSGYIFDFRNALLPVEFTANAPGAMNYYEGLEVSENNPVFTRLKGRQIAETIVKEIVEESAFGSPSVREVTSTRKDWVITWGQNDPYVFDDESTITKEELDKALADRATYLATVKQRQDEFKASKGGDAAPAAATTASTVTAGGFNF